MYWVYRPQYCGDIGWAPKTQYHKQPCIIYLIYIQSSGIGQGPRRRYDGPSGQSEGVLPGQAQDIGQYDARYETQGIPGSEASIEIVNEKINYIFYFKLFIG